MSWAERHKRSESYAIAAELALKKGEPERATEFYCLAAGAEAEALNELDPHHKVRTLGITAVSVAALWYKAGNYQQAKQVCEQWLTHSSLPPFAINQLQELLSESNSHCLSAVAKKIPTDLIASISEKMSPN
jgi:hypothetical protein